MPNYVPLGPLAEGGGAAGGATGGGRWKMCGCCHFFSYILKKKRIFAILKVMV